MRNIVGTPGDGVRVGREVELIFHAAEDRPAVPLFAPTRSQPRRGDA